MKSLAMVVAIFPCAAMAQVTVTDGDTMRVDGQRTRLLGIDAPELRQSCTDGWQAGDASAHYLRTLIEGHHVHCEGSTKDVFGRTLAHCYADGLDINGAMVRAGIARAYVHYSKEYVPQEERARSAKLGIWAHECEAPWDWRHRSEK